MEVFLFSHDLLPTPGAFCFESKGRIHHSGFSFQAPVSVTASSRNFCLILPTSLSASSAPALPAAPILHGANNNLQQRRRENSSDPQVWYYCTFFCSCVLRTANGSRLTSLHCRNLQFPWCHTFLPSTCPACPSVCGTLSPLLSAAMLVLVCSFT